MTKFGSMTTIALAAAGAVYFAQPANAVGLNPGVVALQKTSETPVEKAGYHGWYGGGSCDDDDDCGCRRRYYRPYRYGGYGYGYGRGYYRPYRYYYSGWDDSDYFSPIPLGWGGYGWGGYGWGHRGWYGHRGWGYGHRGWGGWHGGWHGGGWHGGWHGGGWHGHHWR